MKQSAGKIEPVSLSCPAKAPLQARPLMSFEEAGEVQALFKMLSNATRLRLLHALILKPEMRVSELATTIGMKLQAVSNQLQRLADRGILASRREGTQIYYHIVDPCVVSILEFGLCLSEDAQERLT